MPGKSGLRVAVIGATGLVGRQLLDLLEVRRFPVARLLPFSSGRRLQTVRFHGKSLQAPSVDWNSLLSCRLVFMVSSDESARLYGPALAAQGIWVIDDSAEFRLDPRVPLVIPEVNSETLRRESRLIASPNCTMTGLAVAGYPLHREAKVLTARIASYQAVSGAGKAALDEFFKEQRRLQPLLRRTEIAHVLPEGGCSCLPRPIAFNVFPQVGRFDEKGVSTEENKVAAELKKVWNAPLLSVSVTAVRVPVVRGHCLSVWLGFKSPLNPRRAHRLLRKAPGLKLARDGDYPTARSAAGRWPVYAGRLRQGVDGKELCLWVACDNLLKGAALNSLQIAETLLKKRWL